MNQYLQKISDIIQLVDQLPPEQKNELFESIKKVDKEIEIISFKLDRTERVKRTTAILLEETIEELELKRKAVEETNTALKTSMEELKATQAQLVHAEKMASLGELTAGIAHEIQNPLNFVNNFSEVSAELLEEMKEELMNGDTEEVNAIAGDLLQNLEMISHHGKRADGIVKGMLQHSRISSGEKEPTDINMLADEYLRLAYHGLRAKDNDFNADFRAELDEKLPKIKVIPQDIGRVLLNIINNAFHALSSEAERRRASSSEAQRRSALSSEAERRSALSSEAERRRALSSEALAQEDPEFRPLVVVTTKYLEDNIEISIKDNGGGIPETIKDKIFQPFFTTKPTGEGTGLGLSLSYDIITKGHGGELKFETNEGEGTRFTISIPLNSQ